MLVGARAGKRLAGRASEGASMAWGRGGAVGAKELRRAPSKGRRTACQRQNSPLHDRLGASGAHAALP